MECVQSRDTQNHIYFTIRDALKSYDDIEVERESGRAYSLRFECKIDGEHGTITASYFTTNHRIRGLNLKVEYRPDDPMLQFKLGDIIDNY